MIEISIIFLVYFRDSSIVKIINFTLKPTAWVSFTKIMLSNYPLQYRRKTLATTLLKPKSILDMSWEKTLEAGGEVPHIVMNRLLMYNRSQSLESLPTQTIERKGLTLENVTIVPRSFVFKTEKIKHEYF